MGSFTPTFFFGYTDTGEVKHLTRHSQTLCGRWNVTRYISNNKTGMPVPFQDHWTDDSFCAKCFKERDRILRPLLYEKKQRRLI